ncbi:MAG: hypothetical protein JWR02_797 [Mucilaginibacter sp.]|nr:hypothetical protein [Mucilaginibacter sp.]
MKQGQWNLTEWQRIFIGEVPGSFYIELLIRSAIIYILLMVSMRLMGKRMSGLMGRNELVAMVALAAAVGIPLTAPDRGVLPAFIIAFLVVYIERSISAIAYKNPKFDKYVYGSLDTLVKDSVMDFNAMKKVRVSRERLVAQLRSLGFKQLGSIKRVYLEANGVFTIVENEKPGAGLSILPTWDVEFNARLRQSDDIMVCQSCGTTKKKPFPEKTKCPNCKDVNWTAAVE